MRKLLIITAVIEAGAGVALVCCPSPVVALLLGSGLDTPAAAAVARLAGAALFALGITCWLAQYDAKSSAARGLVSAMTLYNSGAVVILGAAAARSQAVGLAFWPAIVLHAAMTVWCITCLVRKPAEIS
jgi:hypothetical protein